MKTKHGHIKLTTDPTFVHKKTMDAINKAVREGKPFALGFQEGDKKGAMIFNPNNFSAVHTGGEAFSYSCWENFADAVRLTLVAYPVFIDCSKMLPDEPTKLLIVDR